MLIFSSILVALYLVQLPQVKDLSSEITAQLSKQESLRKSPHYDFAFVIRPYSSLGDQEGVNLSLIRKKYGDSYKDDGCVLLIFVKQDHVVGFAEVKRSVRNLDKYPNKITP